jgi:hypothetical protein
MKRLGISMIAGILLMTAAAYSEDNSHIGQGRAVITVLPKSDSDGDPKMGMENLKVKVNGKDSSITGWKALRGPASPLELVLLMDSGSSSSIGTQFAEIAQFVKEMPVDTKIAIAYMQNGRAILAGPLTADGKQLEHELRLPTGPGGINASPYFCLSDLAKSWPSSDHTARRVVLMITDGINPYDRSFSQDDPYVETAIRDSLRAGLMVYSVYWHGRGGGNPEAGQNRLLQVSDSTGGKSYWIGMGNPVSFNPFFTDLRRCLRNQYALSFAVEGNGKPDFADLKLRVEGVQAKVLAPQQVFVE